MDYVSTRNKERKVSAAYAIANGIAPDGGLYCPTAFPALTDADWKTLAESDYKGRSALILGKFLTDFTAEELADFASKAYADEKFGGADTAPVVKLGEGKNLLELWHGPTCAFKDMALQMLPHLLTASLRKTGETRTAAFWSLPRVIPARQRSTASTMYRAPRSWCTIRWTAYHPCRSCRW